MDGTMQPKGRSAHGRRMLRWVGRIAGSALLPLAAAAGPAVNQFEMKDLEVDPGQYQFQSQNAFMLGEPRRQYRLQPGGTVFDENTVLRQRHALELEAHLTSFFRSRVGIEYEKERVDDPLLPARANAFEDLKLTSVAVEGVLVLLPVKGNGVGLGIMTEYDHALSRKEADNWYIGPILQAQTGPWRLTANLLAVRFFSPAEAGVRDDKWDFAYAAQLRYSYDETWSFALEGYGTVDRLPGTGVPGDGDLLFGGHDQHRIGPVIYYSYNLGDRLSRRPGAVKAVADDDDKRGSGDAEKDDGQPKAILGVGVLAGITPSTPDLTLKWSLEVEF